MHGGFNRIDSIKCCVRKRHMLPNCISNSVRNFLENAYHEIALHKLQLFSHPILACITSCSLNLICIDIQACDIATCKLGDLTGRTANTTAHIKHFHVLLNSNAVGEVMFVAGNGLGKGLSRTKPAEVKALRPPIFIKVCSEIVVPAISSGKFRVQRGVTQQAYCRVKES